MASQGLRSGGTVHRGRAFLEAGEEKPDHQPGQDGDQQDHGLVREHPAVRGSAGTQDEQDQGQERKGHLDVLAVDL